MIPRVLIDTAELPGGGALRLMRRGDEYSIMLGGNELMNSRLSGSEEALATLAIERVRGGHCRKMLIGGLGMGFTLRAALARLGKDAEVTVAELVPAVVAWAKGPMAALHGESLDDRRVTIVEADVADMIAGARSEYDAILLDVDNGPDGLTVDANDRLYGKAGLGEARDALRPGGVLAVWSAARDRPFAQRLRMAGFEVVEQRARARGTRGAHHIIWTAVR
jgi:spermidine synthase